MELLKAFKELGLDQQHLDLYRAGVEWGETSITNLSERAGLPRTSAYPLMDELISAGLSVRSVKRSQKNYSMVDPEHIKILLERKRSEIGKLVNSLEDSIGELKAFQKVKKQKPKVYYLEGAEGIKKAYEKTFEAEEISIQCFTEDYGEVVGEKWFNDYFDRFFSSNIRSRELLKAESEGDGSYMKKYGSAKNLQLRVKNSVSTETDFMVYGNTVIFVSFNKENPYALVVEDSEIASCVQNMFNLAWKEASRSDSGR